MRPSQSTVHEPRSVYLVYNTSHEGPKAQQWNNRVPARLWRQTGFHSISWQWPGINRSPGTPTFGQRGVHKAPKTLGLRYLRTATRVSCQHCITADDESIGRQPPTVSLPLRTATSILTLAHMRTRDKCASAHVYLKNPIYNWDNLLLCTSTDDLPILRREYGCLHPKRKSPLSVAWRHIGGVEVWFHSFLTSAPVEESG